MRKKSERLALGSEWARIVIGGRGPHPRACSIVFLIHNGMCYPEAVGKSMKCMFRCEMSGCRQTDDAFSVLHTLARVGCRSHSFIFSVFLGNSRKFRDWHAVRKRCFARLLPFFQTASTEHTRNNRIRAFRNGAQGVRDVNQSKPRAKFRGETALSSLIKGQKIDLRRGGIWEFR